MMRLFRFSAALEDLPSASELQARARSIESAGFAALVAPDHLLPLFSPLVALMAAAAATSRLRVGTLVANNDLRHPVLLAKEAATLDVLSDGRLELGMGAGWLREDYDLMDLSYDRPGIRIDRLDEALGIIRACLDGAQISHSGRHYQVQGYDPQPRPVQARVPILVGAGGPKALAVAARHADIVQLNFQLGTHGPQPGTGGFTAARENVAVIRDHAGSRFDSIELATAVFTAVVTDDRENAAREIGGVLGLDADEVLKSPHCAIGTIDEICDHFERLRDDLGISYISCCFNTWTALTPVVARLAGT